MARLINADDFLKRLNERPVDYPDPGCDFYYLEETVESVLAETPTVDAVPVVRCKDCKHYGWEQEPCHGRIQQFCKLHKGLVVVHRGTFCSYGERRTDG